jgi:hypothetical protein
VTIGERLAGALLRRTPTGLLLVAAAAVALWHGLRWLAGHWWLPGAVGFIGWTAWLIDGDSWWLLALPVGIILLALGGWAELHQVRSWRELRAAVTELRRLVWYRRRWERAVDGAGLVRGGELPVLVGVRLGGQRGVDPPYLDVLLVQLATGQLLSDWREAGPRLAGSWNRRTVRAHPVSGRTDQVELYVRHHRVTDASPRPEPATDTAELEQVRPGAFPRAPRRGEA